MRKETKNSILIFIVFLIITILLTFSITYFPTLPNQERGKNDKPYELNFEVYIVNNLTTPEKVYNYFEKGNKIWNQYNISIGIKSINNVNLNLSKEERAFLFNYLSKGVNDTECTTKYIPLIEKITNNSDNLRVIFVDRGSSKYAGRGCVCNCSFVLLGLDKLLFIDFGGLDLAHELGHLFGLFESRGKQNLMTHYPIYMKFFNSYFLNQEQINTIKNRLDELLK